MKLWKHIIISATAFLGISTTMLYTSCKDDACLKLKCRNGGTCSDNFCKCPSGYEGTQCENKAADRYIGRYLGITKISNEPPFSDTVYIDLKSYPATVMIRRVSRYTDSLYGTITPNNNINIKNTDPIYGTREINISLNDNTQNLSFQAVETLNGEIRATSFTGAKK